VEELADLPTAVWVLAGVGVVGMIAALVDLAFHDVKQLPKAAWAVIIIFISFPIGAILYLTLGRVAGPRAAATGEPAISAPRAEDRAASTPLLEVAPPDAAVSTVASQDAVASTATPRDTRPTIVSTDGLGKRYGDTVALSEVDLIVPRGATYGLIGPNGAGKTTMLSILAGLRRPTAGEVHLEVPRSKVAVVVDTPHFEPWLTAREVVDLARNLTAEDLPPSRVDEVLDQVGLAEAIDRRVGGFSRGMLQRVGLAAGLVGHPELLILDEPSAALDPAGRREVLDLIGSLAGTTTVILSTHVLADVQQVCDVVGVIDHGSLRFQGAIQELLARTSTVYALHVRDGAAELRAKLSGLPWVTEVSEPAPGRLRLVVSDATRAEQEVASLVAAAGVSMASFAPATDLETAFLELTS
jgi:ABC-2 type transport system ATP-binding protein